MIRVLFVCLGNICRSPMAEAVFAHLVREAGLESKIEADSAGTGDWHIGSGAHHGTLEILKLNAISYDGRARQISPADLSEFDYIITMDDSNLSDVRLLQAQVKAQAEAGTQGGAGSRAHVAPLLSYAPAAGYSEVPDPYYTGGFQGVYKLVYQGAQGLLEAIRREKGL